MEVKQSKAIVDPVEIERGYLGALRAGVPHFGFARNPLRIDYVTSGHGEGEEKLSIRLDFTDVGFNGTSHQSNPIGSYVLKIENSTNILLPNQYSITLYKGAAGDERLAGPISVTYNAISSDSAILDALDSRYLITKAVVELLVDMAENLHEATHYGGGHRLTLEEHLETSRTMQVLGVIRQAAVDSQQSSEDWADIGTVKRGAP